jgi:hypothetical protein
MQSEPTDATRRAQNLKDDKKERKISKFGALLRTLHNVQWASGGKCLVISLKLG